MIVISEEKQVHRWWKDVKCEHVKNSSVRHGLQSRLETIATLSNRQSILSLKTALFNIQTDKPRHD